ncbi:MAG: hypothetical protein QXU93_05450 [Thermoproteus sp.]
MTHVILSHRATTVLVASPYLSSGHTTVSFGVVDSSVAPMDRLKVSQLIERDLARFGLKDRLETYLTSIETF